MRSPSYEQATYGEPLRTCTHWNGMAQTAAAILCDWPRVASAHTRLEDAVTHRPAR